MRFPKNRLGRQVVIAPAEERMYGKPTYVVELREAAGGGQYVLTPPVPLGQAKTIAAIVRNYSGSKNMAAAQIGSELYRSFFAPSE